MNNVPTWYDGYKYPSKAEANYAMELDRRKRVGEIVSWRRQVPFKVYDADGNSFEMVVDFLVVFRDRQEIHEVKYGLHTDKFIFKVALWPKTYPFFRYLIAEQDRNRNFTYKTPKQFLESKGIREEAPQPAPSPQIIIEPEPQPAWYRKPVLLMITFVLGIALAAIIHHWSS